MLKGLRKPKKTSMYQLNGIDTETWRIFGAKCKLEGKTIKEKLIGFIEESIR